MRVCLRVFSVTSHKHLKSLVGVNVRLFYTDRTWQQLHRRTIGGWERYFVRHPFSNKMEARGELLLNMLVHIWTPLRQERPRVGWRSFLDV